MGWRSLFRRDKPLHQLLAERGGLDAEAHAAEVLQDTRPRWGEVGIHGIHRQRRWDALATTDAPGLAGNTVTFVALPDGSLLVDDDLAAEALTPLADALEAELEPPYRAEGARQSDDVWAVAARRIDVASIDQEIDGDEIELAMANGQRTVVVDGRPAFGSIAALERLGEGRFDDFVVRASRLDGDLWEVAVAPL